MFYRNRIKGLLARFLSVSLIAATLTVLSVGSASAVTVAQAEQNTLILATTADGDGTPASALTQAADQTFSQVGWVTDTRTSSLTTTGGVYVTGGSLATANVLAGAKIGFKATGSDTGSEGLSIVVTGGTLSISAAATNAAAITLGSTTPANYAALNGSSTTFVADGSASGSAKNGVAGIFNVTAAVGSVATISIYSGADITSLATATNGTFRGSWRLTVVAANAVGVPTVADSNIFQQPCLANSTTGSTGTNNFDTTSACANGQVGVIYVDLNDVYGGAAGTGVTVSANASAGLVKGSSTAAAGNTINSATAGFDTIANEADGVMFFFVKQPTANTAGSATVTITLNGATAASKTIRWLGDVATLDIDEKNSCKIFSVNQATDTQEGNIGDGCVKYVAKDAAGNAVTLSAQPSVSAATGALVGSTLSASAGAVTSGYSFVQTSSVGYGWSTLLVPNNTLSGAGTYQLQLTNAAGATIKSKVVSVTVSRGSTGSFTASWDKAQYAPGDIATLTITAKDAYGNLMASGTPLTGLSIVKNDTNFATVGTACSATSTFSNGVKTCTYSVGNTDGGYAWSVALDTATSQDPVLGNAKIASGSISNAEVLASIVKLIAAINKQIRALQKSLRR